MIIVILFLFSNKLQGVAKKSRSKLIKPSNTSDGSDNGEADEILQQPSGTIFCFLLISKGSTKNIQSTLL